MSEPTHQSRLERSEGGICEEETKSRRPRSKEPKEKKKNLTKVRTGVTFEASWKFDVCEVLKDGGFEKPWECEDFESGGNESLALYRSQNWVGVIPPKIWGEMPAVGSSSHCRTWGTKCHLEHLMKTLQTPKHQNGYKAREVTFSRVEFNEACVINCPGSKPHFPPRMREKKPKFWGAIMECRNLTKWCCHVSYLKLRRPMPFLGDHTLRQ